MGASRPDEVPEDPAELIAEIYKALRSKEYSTLALLCHVDFVFTCNAHPKWLDRPVYHVGIKNARKHLELVKQEWEILDTVPGAPKLQPLSSREPRDGGYVYNVTVQIHMRNRRSGLEFKGTKRQEWLIHGGRVSAMSEFLDVHNIDAMKANGEMV